MSSIQSIGKRGTFLHWRYWLASFTGCSKVAEDYACLPTEDAGYREEAVCLRVLCTKHLVKVKRFTCTNGRDHWLKVEP